MQQPTLHSVIGQRFDVDVSKDTIWRRLREAGLTYQKPEREYYEIDEQSRKDWIKHTLTHPEKRKRTLIASHDFTFSIFQNTRRIGTPTKRFGTTWSIKSWYDIKQKQKKNWQTSLAESSKAWPNVQA
jgi:hypothetical protein